MTNYRISLTDMANHESGEVSEWVTRMASDQTLMCLIPYEIDRAWTIKEMVEANDEIQNLSDFEYVQYVTAVNASEGYPRILERIQMMQAFREQYNITDEPEQAVSMIDQSIRQHPGVWLAFDHLPDEQDFLTVYDVAKYAPAEQLRTEEQFRIFMVGRYYMCQCQTCCFQMMRQGDTWVIECEGITYQQLSMEVYTRVIHEFFRWYPRKFRDIQIHNPSSFLHIFINTFKRVLPTSFTRAFRLGDHVHGLDGIRVGELYSSPSHQEKLLRNVYGALMLRWKHQTEFVLPPRSMVED